MLFLSVNGLGKAADGQNKILLFSRLEVFYVNWWINDFAFNTVLLINEFFGKLGIADDVTEPLQF